MIEAATSFKSLNCRGKLISLEKPLVMGILNVTPDSFSDGGKYMNKDAALERIAIMIEEGAEIIDIGGYSSRPGAAEISSEEELNRIHDIVKTSLREFPETLISVDTFRAEVAKAMLELGVHIINDISAGSLDTEMLPTVAAYDAPYIAMHMQGTPANMQKNPVYGEVFEEVWQYFVNRINVARSHGIKDIVLDPGFGFGKKLVHNYRLFNRLKDFQSMGLPLMIGISRKSMLYKPFNTTPKDVLDLAGALHLQALKAGVNILRVHDVKNAKRIVELYRYLKTENTL